jgi:molybdate transport system substrate-binding protein
MSRKAVAFLAASLFASGAAAAELRVLSAGAMRAPVTLILAGYEQKTGDTVKIDYATAGEIARRVEAGGRYDVLIVPDESIEAYDKAGKAKAASRVPLGKVGIGVGVREGARVPDIATPDAFKAALLNAKSIVHIDPERGTSGRYLHELFEKMGIADALKGKTRYVTEGHALEPVARGEVELGLQQMSEVMAVKGVKGVGYVPEPYQKWTVYSGVVTPGAADGKKAAELLRYLAAREATPAFQQTGFTRP